MCDWAALGVFKSETMNSSTGLPPWWSEVLFVCVLRPVLARGLLYRVLTAPFASQLACFKVLTALPPGQLTQNYISAILSNLKEFVFACQV